uniref:Uncharacterized protein n=1 Tax=viral metagenome TaxID=1070528 RepID=A0A6H1Z8H1_9ZZZZ
MSKGTYLERLAEETLRPIRGALELLRNDIAETMNIPDAPWKILGKPYDKLTEQELVALFDIYHQDGETEPCPMCHWATQVELREMGKVKREMGLEK